MYVFKKGDPDYHIMLNQNFNEVQSYQLTASSGNAKSLPSDVTSFTALASFPGFYYLTTTQSKAMTDFAELPPEFIYGVFVENNSNTTNNNFLQKITSNVTDGVTKPPVRYWRVVQKKDNIYTPTMWRKYVSQENTVNTTEPQSIGGVKNFLDAPTIKNVQVATVSDLDKTAITTISDKDGEISDYNLNGAIFGFGSEIKTTGTKPAFSRNADKKLICQVAGTYIFNGELSVQVRTVVDAWHYVDMRANGKSVGSPWSRGAQSLRNRWNFAGLLQVTLKIGDVIDFVSSSSETGATTGQYISCPLATFQRIGD